MPTPRTTIATQPNPNPADTPVWNRQRPSQMPSHRYREVFDRVEVPLTEREWPTRRLTQAPLWVPVDLRDGNQALAEPMDPIRKRRFFELMVAMGYKEIEVGYPSASQTDYDFVRLLAEGALAPQDLTIVVFTPARRELIERTVEAIRDIPNPVVIHMYTATAPIWRDVVLGHDRAVLKELILTGGRDILEFTEDLPNVRFEFSPEVFNLTEPGYALEVCNAMTELWDARPSRPVIINLPATVEVATPNVYADQIEYMHRNLERRDSVILSIHPHNDRGTGVACAELAVLAGAERVEGCIFGNGERTGNVDIATLALNLHAQGIDPMVDFSDIDEIRRTVEYCNRLEVHPRHPYVGDLVHTAFSGTHQDAIKKGLAEHRERADADVRNPAEIPWRVPYLPIDPTDIGRTYDAVIRVNSQSGKGGIAYLLQSRYGIVMPRRLQIDFARHVQKHTDTTGTEIDADDLWKVFQSTYLRPHHDDSVVSLVSYQADEIAGRTHTRLGLRVGGVDHTTAHDDIGPVEALTKALEQHGLHVDIADMHQTSVGVGNDSDALTFVECRIGTAHSQWFAGRDQSALGATLSAVVAAAAAAA
ncbi:2-isopropylmalate synthase [Williamsia sp.]|uniref:2-isopropylmalate synthase n=1 Tax=Williamsia sp. TaxID=1872085 RepID=UPI0039C8D387